MASLEIEIKSLLGSPERADKLRKKLREIEPATKLVSQHSQLNHYFKGGDVYELYELLSPHLSAKEARKLRSVIDAGSDFSIRTRLIDDKKLLFVIKASRDEGTSHNTITRLELETPIKKLSLEELDQLVLSAGFRYQAKWSREREEYQCNDIDVCLDKNAGYGYLAEFERVIDEDERRAEAARRELKAFMQRLGVEELPQDRLERMFAFYNANWPEYYGTEKIFVVE